MIKRNLMSQTTFRRITDIPEIVCTIESLQILDFVNNVHQMYNSKRKKKTYFSLLKNRDFPFFLKY